MGLARQLAEQLARPQGLTGRVVGNAMDLANRRPTRLALDLLAANPGERVLDAGCGTGAALELLLCMTPVEAIGIDASPTMIAAARRRLGDRARLALGPIEQLPFGNSSFDAVLALNVLYFADAERAMIREIHRVLRPGGRLVAYVTELQSMLGWTFARQGLHQLYSGPDLLSALSKAGFAPERIHLQEEAITASVQGLFALAEK